MSDNTENYFYCNRNQQAQELYFRKWLLSIYLPSVKVLRKANLNRAEAQYRHGLEEGIELCNKSSSGNKRKLEDILSQFDTMQRYLGVEKGKRQSEEQEQNLTLIRNNINFIMGGCNAKIHGECSEESLSVYTELFNILQCLDLETIEPEIPIASGVINLTGNEDIFTKLLTLKMKQILSRHSFCNNEFSNQIGAMLDEFVSSYSELRTDFDPALMRPISFPYREMILGTRCILITTFDLLEGLRRIWSCRLSLIEEDYSKNSYVIHAVSKVLDLLFTYSKWPLKRAWSKQTSKSSQSRKNQMGFINLGKKPDLQVLLKLDMKANELVLVEISCLFPEQDKEVLDWKKLDTSSRARLIHCELGKIPVLGIQVIGKHIFVSMLDLFEGVFYRVYRVCEITIPLRISTRQVVEEFLRGSLRLRAIVEEIVRMLVSIKDEINLLLTCEKRTPSTSMMSTTYSPPRNS
ncbi:hypothetical protein F8M41_004994 [Gigaspora margarita]|uniref:Uncharacterized protein n=2 Tax=Gigaspora margarita TaxID=4874 RepID=A0A8H3XA41_GIGMA|nr:hypothetical protein F8M41_004994 [Gigaspora margarita]